jgi:hypothetical protein
MKNTFYIFVAMILFFSCKSIDKMVEKGDYDGAFRYAVKNLRGEKNKKTEYVKGLEKAYNKLNQADMNTIERLDATNRPQNWEKVLGIYKTLDKRQITVEPLLPLVSADGYVADIRLNNYNNALNHATENTVKYYYSRSLSLMEQSEQLKSRSHAREAYTALQNLRNYNPLYKDADQLLMKAYELGTTSVAFDIINHTGHYYSGEIERVLTSMPIGSMNTKWTRFNSGDGKSVHLADYIIVIELSDLEISPERERTNQFREDREILSRTDEKIVRKDSVPTVVRTEVYEKVSAYVTEIHREKLAFLTGKTSLYDNRNQTFISTAPVSISYTFAGYGSSFIGDARALTDGTKKRLDPYLEAFPDDLFVIRDMGNSLSGTVMNEIRRYKFN